MTIEDIFFSFFAKDTYVIQNVNFLEDDSEFINSLLNKKEPSETEKQIICCVLSAFIYTKFSCNLDIKTKEYEIYEKSNGLRYGIFYLNDCLYLVFKGSSTIRDFVTNSNITLVKTKLFPGKVHGGFYDLLEENHKSIFKSLLDFSEKHKCNSIYITGHSLGGALSSLFYSLCKRHKQIQKKTPISIKNVTFGSPRVGDSKFCKNLNTCRMVNKKDIVTMLPFPICYRHLSVKQHFEPSYGLPSIKDHSISEYYYCTKLRNFFLKSNK